MKPMKITLLILVATLLASPTTLFADQPKVKKKDVEKIADVIDGEPVDINRGDVKQLEKKLDDDCDLFDDKEDCREDKKGGKGKDKGKDKNKNKEKGKNKDKN
jgi:hypothetical protein